MAAADTCAVEAAEHAATAPPDCAPTAADPAAAELLTTPQGPEVLHVAALGLLVGEARRLDHRRATTYRSAGRNAPTSREIDRRWRALYRSARSSLDAGSEPEAVRAELAAQFPFLGILPAEALHRCRDRQAAIIERLRQQGKLFLDPSEAALEPLEDCYAAATAVQQPPAGSTPQASDGAEQSEVDVTSALTCITAAVTAASAAAQSPEPSAPNFQVLSDSSEIQYHWDPVSATTSWFTQIADDITVGAKTAALWASDNSDTSQPAEEPDVATSRLFTSWSASLTAGS
eukprot:TRINITY_DN70935_c0_g1_i1.p1 TRINITY_DN70935_c0_g1~~TRINITY_DN70935_c0_g1_i1.p1  ORF type:complete len:289 (+),score=77.76 TRINITY_DN70935_c0_g1_i1:122-988(+)